MSPQDHNLLDKITERLNDYAELYQNEDTSPETQARLVDTIEVYLDVIRGHGDIFMSTTTISVPIPNIMLYNVWIQIRENDTKHQISGCVISKVETLNIENKIQSDYDRAMGVI